MAVIPVQRTWTVGEKVTAAMLNDDLRDAVDFLTRPPCCRVFQASVLVANTTLTYVAFGNETYDTDTMHSASVNTSRITFQTQGVFSGTFRAEFPGNVGGSERQARVQKNGSTLLTSEIVPRNAAAATHVSGAFADFFFVGDYIELGLYHDAGSTQTLPNVAMSAKWECRA